MSIAYFDSQCPGIPWFYTLLGNGLRKMYPLETKPITAIVVRRKYKIVENGKEEVCQSFAQFPDRKTLYDYILKIPEDQRDFYEFVHDTDTQKPRFDVDITTDLPDEKADQLFNDVITNLTQAIKKYADITHLKLYTSHGKGKRSGHLILAQHYHLTSRGAKSFYLKVITGVNEEYRQYVDRAVYSKGQNFRLLYCQKWGSGRIKLLQHPKGGGVKKDYSYEDFLESLLTQVYSNFTKIDEEELQHKSGGLTNSFIEGELPYEIICAAVQALTDVMNKADASQLPYTVRSNIGQYILLQRTQASYCALHGRVHDAENPYISIKYHKEDGSYSAVFWCRRDPPKSFPLGRVWGQSARQNVAAGSNFRSVQPGLAGPGIPSSMGSTADEADKQKELGSVNEQSVTTTQPIENKTINTITSTQITVQALQAEFIESKRIFTQDDIRKAAQDKKKKDEQREEQERERVRQEEERLKIEKENKIKEIEASARKRREELMKKKAEESARRS